MDFDQIIMNLPAKALNELAADYECRASLLRERARIQSEREKVASRVKKHRGKIKNHAFMLAGYLHSGLMLDQACRTCAKMAGMEPSQFEAIAPQANRIIKKMKKTIRDREIVLQARHLDNAELASKYGLTTDTISRIIQASFKAA